MNGRSYRIAPRVRGKVWLEADGRFALGDGGVRLLQAIEEAGSIRAAAQLLGWSNRHALAYIDNAERMLDEVLVARTRGGNDRGGARLTETGRDFVRRYGRFRVALDGALHRLYESAFPRRR